MTSTARTDASILPDDAATSTTVSGHGVRLHAVKAGTDDGPLVAFRHGFSEFWYGWRGR